MHLNFGCYLLLLYDSQVTDIPIASALSVTSFEAKVLNQTHEPIRSIISNWTSLYKLLTPQLSSFPCTYIYFSFYGAWKCVLLYYFCPFVSLSTCSENAMHVHYPRNIKLHIGKKKISRRWIYNFMHFKDVWQRLIHRNNTYYTISISQLYNLWFAYKTHLLMFLHILGKEPIEEKSYVRWSIKRLRNVSKDFHPYCKIYLKNHILKKINRILLFKLNGPLC